MDNEKLLISRISDNKRLSEKYQSPKFSDFLDENESAVIKAELSLSGGMFFGGYEGAKRTMIGYFPDWYDGGYDDFPISVIEIIKKSGKELTHRDYLGTVMSLGLERRKIGDIVVTDRGAYVFVCSDIKELVLSIEKIASSGVRTKEIPIGEADIPEAEFEIMDTVSASLRLDSVLSGVLKLSRKNTQDYIKSGRCSVNHRVTERNDYTLKVGDTLSLRGFGRYEVFFIGNITRSGRLHMQIKKYI